MDFDSRFATEAACRTYLIQLRWPDGFQCPHCGQPGAWQDRAARLICRTCRRHCRITAGTIFHDSHISLRVWFKAIWWMTNQKTGMSALGLQRALGLGSYRTAWLLLHKLRQAMVRPGRDPLTGTIEVDETMVGGYERGGGRRHLGNKALVIVAAQADGTGIGRIRLRRVPDGAATPLLGFVKAVVAPGSLVLTDGYRSYAGLQAAGFRHRPRVRGADPARASKLLPRVHRVIALLKRWLLGTHQGSVSHAHLDAYLDEFTFRFNRRKSQFRGKLFRRVLEHAVLLIPTTYRQLVRQKRRKPHNP
jgi:transposase-like protein